MNCKAPAILWCFPRSARRACQRRGNRHGNGIRTSRKNLEIRLVGCLFLSRANCLQPTSSTHKHGSHDDGDDEPELVPPPDKDIITKINLHGYDQIVALYEESINIFYRRSRKSSEGSLMGWSEGSFDARFRPIRVKLLSGERAVVMINIQEGFFGVDK